MLYLYSHWKSIILRLLKPFCRMFCCSLFLWTSSLLSTLPQLACCILVSSSSSCLLTSRIDHLGHLPSIDWFIDCINIRLGLVCETWYICCQHHPICTIGFRGIVSRSFSFTLTLSFMSAKITELNDTFSFRLIMIIRIIIVVPLFINNNQ